MSAMDIMDAKRKYKKDKVAQARKRKTYAYKHSILRHQRLKKQANI